VRPRKSTKPSESIEAQYRMSDLKRPPEELRARKKSTGRETLRTQHGRFFTMKGWAL
jgi:hypothetical protein